MCTILEIEFCKFENIKPQIMKTKLFTLIISVMAIFGFTGASGQDASYKQLWEQMREADKKDHPKTVVEICDKIVAKARRESNRGQLLKAWFTRVEYKIVSFLAGNSGKVITYDALINQIWGPYAGDNNRILRVNMANIRRKLEKNPGEPEYIFTELGVGYRMIEDEG